MRLTQSWGSNRIRRGRFVAFSFRNIQSRRSCRDTSASGTAARPLRDWSNSIEGQFTDVAQDAIVGHIIEGTS